jgi:hydroxylamine dehydrogenase
MKGVIGALAGVLLLVVPAWGANEGERLFILKGCIGCHGVGAHRGAGPDLANTPLMLDQFRQQVRQPRAQMPPFPASVVTDADLQRIHAYLKTLTAKRDRLKEPPQGEQTAASCVECHRKHNPVLVAQYESSAMFKPGRQNPRIPTTVPEANSCAICHGANHTEITHVRGRVSEKVCAACHPQIYQEHVTDLGHSYGPGPAGIGGNWDRNIRVPHYAQMPRKVMEMGCDPCHAQAGATDEPFWDPQQKKYTDLSSLQYRNGCIACHTRHRFDPAEARRAEACMTCHMGPDHPNWEAYSTSKHGAVYLTDGARWDWSKSMAEGSYNAPTCAYCHMVYADAGGKRTVSHNMTRKIIWGMGVQPAIGQLEDITRTPENRAKRNEMIRVCLSCHSEVKARDYLEGADAHKLMGDALVIEARETLRELFKDRIIDPRRRALSAGILPGPRYTAVEDAPGGTFWPAGLYYDVQPIERDYFDMFFFANLKSYKGAFHMSPDYAWWYGYAEVLGHATRIRDESTRLRTEHRITARTSFMLYTGPLMVLVVVGVVWAGRAVYARRRGGTAR